MEFSFAVAMMGSWCDLALCFALIWIVIWLTTGCDLDPSTKPTTTQCGWISFFFCFCDLFSFLLLLPRWGVILAVFSLIICFLACIGVRLVYTSRFVCGFPKGATYTTECWHVIVCAFLLFGVVPFPFRVLLVCFVLCMVRSPLRQTALRHCTAV